MIGGKLALKFHKSKPYALLQSTNIENQSTKMKPTKKTKFFKALLIDVVLSLKYDSCFRKFSISPRVDVKKIIKIHRLCFMMRIHSELKTQEQLQQLRQQIKIILFLLTIFYFTLWGHLMNAKPQSRATSDRKFCHQK